MELEKKIGKQKLIEVVSEAVFSHWPETRISDNYVSRIDRVRQLRDFRGRRAHFLREDIFGEPCWDILLFLYENSLNGRIRCLTKEASFASKVPYTTSLRCLDILAARNLVYRASGHDDRRRTYISLTPIGKNAMDLIFEQLAPSMAPHKQAGN